jgi:hypothetical protein
MTTTETDAVHAPRAANDAAAFVAAHADHAAATLPGAHQPNRDASHATMVNTFATSLKHSGAGS